MPENHAPPKEFVEWRRLHYERREGRTAISEARAAEDWKRYGPGWRAAIAAAAKVAHEIEFKMDQACGGSHGHHWIAAGIEKLKGE